MAASSYERNAQKSVAAMVREMVDAEIAEIEKSGKKVRFKKVIRKHLITTLIFGFVFMSAMLYMGIVLQAIVLLLYFAVMYSITNASVIASIAEKTPNTPIDEIIRSEMMK